MVQEVLFSQTCFSSRFFNVKILYDINNAVIISIIYNTYPVLLPIKVILIVALIINKIVNIFTTNDNL